MVGNQLKSTYGIFSDRDTKFKLTLIVSFIGYAVGKGRKVTMIFTKADSFLAAPFTLPGFIRKSRFDKFTLSSCATNRLTLIADFWLFCPLTYAWKPD